MSDQPKRITPERIAELWAFHNVRIHELLDALEFAERENAELRHRADFYGEQVRELANIASEITELRKDKERWDAYCLDKAVAAKRAAITSSPPKE